MKLIGKGSFTKAYLKNNKTVLLKSIDPIKECMSFGWFPSSRLFPKIKRITTNDDNVSLYEMKYYPKVKSLKQNLKLKEYEKYKELRSLDIRYSVNPHDSFFNTRDAFKKIKNRTLRKHMIDAIEACSNYGGDIAFEISPRNVAVNNGNLVLLDCFFKISTLRETRD